jgi:prevent-host-death family protein
MRISTADFIKKFGELADQALAEPVRITKHGRDRLVVLSAAEYDRLKRRDRRVVRIEDLTDEDLELIAQAEVPAEFAHLDADLENWKP